MDIQKEIETFIGYVDDNSLYGQFEASDRKEHTTDKCRKATLNLHNIRKFRNSLDDENTKNIIYALVSSQNGKHLG